MTPLVASEFLSAQREGWTRESTPISVESRLCHSQAVRPWASRLHFLCLCFLVTVQQELIFKEKRGHLPSSTAHLYGVLNIERGISQGQSPREQGPTPSSPWASGALAVADSVRCSLGKGKSPTSEQPPLHGGGKPCALTGRRRSGL